MLKNRVLCCFPRKRVSGVTKKSSEVIVHVLFNKACPQGENAEFPKPYQIMASLVLYLLFGINEQAGRLGTSEQLMSACFVLQSKAESSDAIIKQGLKILSSHAEPLRIWNCFIFAS